MHKVFKYVGNTHNSDGQETVNAQQHRLACNYHYTGERGHGQAMRKLIEGWAGYADACRSQFDGVIGEVDHVLGPQWQAIGCSLLALLDGPVGGWDCGSLHHNIKVHATFFVVVPDQDSVYLVLSSKVEGNMLLEGRQLYVTSIRSFFISVGNVAYLTYDGFFVAAADRSA